MKRLYLRGLNTTYTGNVSARASDESKFWITPSSRDKFNLRPEDLSYIDISSGERLFGEKESSEYKLHLMIYRKRSDVKAVIHAHPPYTNILARKISRSSSIRESFNEFYQSLYEALTYIGKYDLVGDYKPGSWELAEEVSERFYKDRDISVVLMLNHGIVAVGRDLSEALNKVEVFEDLAKMYILEILWAK
jgi:L-ribulose-5-phosphate 4-epimerase